MVGPGLYKQDLDRPGQRGQDESRNGVCMSSIIHQVCDWSKIKYFQKFECACNCCGLADIDHHLMELADEVRQLYGHPIKVNSGVRCTKHNTSIGGSRDSYHIAMPSRDILGCAMDLAPIERQNLWKLIQAVYEVFGDKHGVIKYLSFAHVDTREKSYRGKR